jgi:D-xylose reductase
MTPTLKLASGDQLPVVGLGTWKIERPAVSSLVQSAIQVGYRHLDCACDYGNEAEVGQGIRASLAAGACRREDLWITSKLWNTYHAPDHVRPAAERSLHDLGVDYLDLYLVHFPIALEYVAFDVRYPPGWLADPEKPAAGMKTAKVPLAETWRAMEALVDDGLVRNIGVCNFNCALLRDLLSYARIRPAVLQIELHPYLTQEKLLRFCRQEQIAVTGFSPFGALSYLSLGMAGEEDSVLKQPPVEESAQRHGKTPAQIVLRWGVERGTAIVPKTSNVERLKENLALFDFELSKAEMQAISALDRGRRFNDPGQFCEAAFHTFYPIYE